jgi:hypothetical protein
MALSFPVNPQIGDTYVAPNGYTYTWDGTKWFVSSSGQTAGGTSPITIKDEGVAVNTQTTTINFIGSAITATTTGSQVNITVTAEPLTTATTSTLGGVKIGSGISINNGVISVREGLQYWTESKTVVDETASTISLIVNSIETNVTAVIKSKGSGATTNDAAGDFRGEFAVDWQRIRGADTEVASGNFSVISGGSFNKATGLHSVVVGGNNHTNDADYAVILGGVNGNTRGIKGAVITPGLATGGASNANGTIQSGLYILGGETASSSPISLTTDGNPTVTAQNLLTLVDNSAVYFKGTVMGKEINVETPEIAVWNIEGVIKRQVDSTTTNYYYVGVFPPSAQLVEAINSNTAWSVILDLDNTLGSMLINVQGQTGRTIRWTAKLETIEITDLGM